MRVRISLATTRITILLATLRPTNKIAALVAILLAKFGEPMKEKIDRHFNVLALLFGVLLIGGFLAIKLLSGH